MKKSPSLSRKERILRRLPEIEYSLILIHNRLVELWESLPQHKSSLVLGLTVQTASRNMFDHALRRRMIPGFVVMNGRVARYDDMIPSIRYIFTCENPTCSWMDHWPEVNTLLDHFCTLVDAREYVITDSGKHATRIRPTVVDAQKVGEAIEAITKRYSITRQPGVSHG